MISNTIKVQIHVVVKRPIYLFSFYLASKIEYEAYSGCGSHAVICNPHCLSWSIDPVSLEFQSQNFMALLNNLWHPQPIWLYIYISTSIFAKIVDTELTNKSGLNAEIPSTVRKRWRATAWCGKSKFTISSGWLTNGSLCHPDDIITLS